ncbi:hypothetical protein CPB83DRAFT_757527 [Crepidotus variabilis]|uniref:DNA-directed RNA polymerase I subunit RPA34 n=1 Tax=Crepidotus variabilis TaxID=179855 RepID=A0A9P6ER91_9AGAR|nr:hypothetical protein CPB83DRAFT_757527 [Crepidotus variabilis]
MSATPPPAVSEKKKYTVNKPKPKGKKKATAVASTEGRNEGEESNWDYKPPLGAVLVEDQEGDAGNFDWDVVNDDDDLELCLIRVPDAIKPKHMENLKIDFPSRTTHSTCVGTLQRKVASFDIWSIGSSDDKNIELPVGEEIKSISCLLPRKKKKGKLYPGEFSVDSPKPITNFFVLAAQPVLPIPPETDVGDSDVGAVEYKNPPRYSYPKNVLKHRFLPTGARGKKEGESSEAELINEESDIQMDEDSPLVELPSSDKKVKQDEEAIGEVEPDLELKKGKKRKGDVVHAPVKRSKRTKTS